MWRLLAACVLVACVTDRHYSTIENRAAVGPRTLEGAYWCSILNDGFQYPRFPCVIRTVDRRLVLTKLAGSQRFRGVVRPRGDGFSFDGEYYCPWGDCTQQLHGAFHASGEALRGSFPGGLVIELVPAPDSAFGGTSYAGTGYAGARYGSNPAP
ncbi:MAG TPA: hypothetical protein VLX92_14060 [Kofleriaceae bacterium]|nr:hypothetical protein [Kofleriaceae bacterium]